MSDRQPQNESFVLIGAGAVGSALAISLQVSGFRPVQIINRTIQKALGLSKILGHIPYSDNLSSPEEADFYIIATQDDNIPKVISELNGLRKPVFHTSGSTPMSVFDTSFLKYGVLYPLQTFTFGREINMKQVPVLLEASDEETLAFLKKIANAISEKLYFFTSDQRMRAHISAVLTANFTNHLFVLGKTYLRQNHLPEEILEELTKETLSKIVDQGAEISQTGPAKRGDKRILEKHIQFLGGDKNMQDLYIFVSNSIINHYTSNKNKNDEL